MIKNPGFIKTVVKRELLPASEIHQIVGSENDAFQLFLNITNQGLMSRDQASRLWADSFGVAWVDLGRTLIQKEVLSLLPRKLAERHGMVLLYRTDDASTFGQVTITAAIADPTNVAAIQEVEKITRHNLSIVCSLPDEIRDAIQVQYLLQGQLEELEERSKMKEVLQQHAEGAIELDVLKRMGGEQAIVDLVKAILLLAVKEDASDIHFDPLEDKVMIRYRIDGMLSDRKALSKETYVPCVARIKVLSQMNLIERRRPQDGRLSIALESRSLDFRVSTVPTVYGEKTVLRFLGQLKNQDVPSLEDLWLSKELYLHTRKIVTSPNGVFFITGPTGCGKTTTLFAALKHISSPSINIVTIEDPVEYKLPRINQVEVNEDLGLNFASAIRTFLRQDPDVMLIGEIRDLETARTAVQAALTGHLVLSTLHTNNALQAVTRLIEIGVQPFLVGPSLIGIMAQRLVRKICDQCKEPYRPEDSIIDETFEWDGKNGVTFYRGKGCPACRQTGYQGRFPIHELVVVTEEVRRLVQEGGSLTDILEASIAAGYKPMRYDALKKMLRGMTTIDEVNRVIPFV